MLKWRITHEAKEDMRDIRLFTKNKWGEAQSIRYLEEIRAKIRTLAEMPSLGVNRSSEYGFDVYSTLVGSHATKR